MGTLFVRDLDAIIDFPNDAGWVLRFPIPDTHTFAYPEYGVHKASRNSVTTFYAVPSGLTRELKLDTKAQEWKHIILEKMPFKILQKSVSKYYLIVGDEARYSALMTLQQKPLPTYSIGGGSIHAYPKRDIPPPIGLGYSRSAMENYAYNQSIIDKYQPDINASIANNILKQELEKRKNKMDLGKAFRAIFRKEPEKSFYKAGVIDDRGDLTREGSDLFMRFLLEKNKEAFNTEIVQEILKEEISEKD